VPDIKTEPPLKRFRESMALEAVSVWRQELQCNSSLRLAWGGFKTQYNWCVRKYHPFERHHVHVNMYTRWIQRYGVRVLRNYVYCQTPNCHISNFSTHFFWHVTSKHESNYVILQTERN
jgi:hypothetical protein